MKSRRKDYSNGELRLDTSANSEALGRTAEGLSSGLTALTVAVGTTIADRPPHRSVLARLRIRLLRRMSGVEACIRIGMQNPGWWNPPVQDWVNRSHRIWARWLRRTRTLCQSLHTRSLTLRN